MLNIESLKSEIKTVFDEVKTYDGSSGKTGDDSIDKIAEGIAAAVDNYIKSMTITILQTDIVAGALSNSGGPVVAASPIVLTNAIS